MHDAEAIAALDRFYPPCGPCAFCDIPDKRHRLWDALMDSPGNAQFVAREFDVTVEHVRAVRRVRPYRNGGKALPPNAAAKAQPAEASD